jgi:hypothetical protein
MARKSKDELAERLRRNVDEAKYDVLKGIRLERGTLVKGQGRGGSVRLAHVSSESFDLAQTRVEDAEPTAKGATKAK